MMKLFELRNNLLKMSFSNFKTQLSNQNSLSAPDCKNLTVTAYENKRSQFCEYLLALYPYSNSIVDAEVNGKPLFFEICSSGTVDEIRAIISIHPDIPHLTKKGQALFVALDNHKKRQDLLQALQIIKFIVGKQPQYVDCRRNQPLIAEAIQKQQYEVVLFLIEQGADCRYVTANGDNLLHLLMKSYCKGYEKIILQVRSCLIERGVDQNKKNVNAKKPLQFCPQLQKKIQQQQKQNKKKSRNQNNNFLNTSNNNGQDYKKTKGKSEQGWDTSRNKNSEQKIADDGVVYLKLDSKLDEIQIQREANSIMEKYTNEKEKQLKRKKMQKGKDKQKQFKNRVMTPDELKFYLQEDIRFETDIIEQQNRKQRTFLNQLVQNITEKIKTQLDANVKIFGSFATQLCLPQSDIDMVIIPSSNKQHNSFRLLENIYHLLEAMKDQIQNAKFIKTASVPIIKIQCTPKYLQKKIDITYQDENHNGLESVELIQQYLAIYPQLRPLTFILKKFIYSARLFDPYSGGISSYGLILMIVAYLQNDNRERKKNKSLKNQPPMISQILIGFLRFYGFKCNYIGKRICVLHPQKAKMEMEAKFIDMPLDPIYLTVMDVDQIYNNDWQPRAKLVILDPLNQNNNVGRATHKIRQIRTAFQMAYVCIHTNKTCSKKKICESYQRIRDNVQTTMRYEQNRRPCCIIKRMLKSANTISIS